MSMWFKMLIRLMCGCRFIIIWVMFILKFRNMKKVWKYLKMYFGNVLVIGLYSIILFRCSGSWRCNNSNNKISSSKMISKMRIRNNKINSNSSRIINSKIRMISSSNKISSSRRNSNWKVKIKIWVNSKFFSSNRVKVASNKIWKSGNFLKRKFGGFCVL